MSNYSRMFALFCCCLALSGLIQAELQSWLGTRFLTSLTQFLLDKGIRSHFVFVFYIPFGVHYIRASF